MGAGLASGFLVHRACPPAALARRLASGKPREFRTRVAVIVVGQHWIKSRIGGASATAFSYCISFCSLPDGQRRARLHVVGKMTQIGRQRVDHLDVFKPLRQHQAFDQRRRHGVRRAARLVACSEEKRLVGNRVQRRGETLGVPLTAYRPPNHVLSGMG